LSRVLFHPLIGGFLLSAILAAVMSTISSQLLVTSSSMTEDIYRTFLNKEASSKNMLIMSRASGLVVAAIAVLLSLNSCDSFLGLVGTAWAGFEASFVPLVILPLLWKGIKAMGGLVGMLVGGVVVLLWVYMPHDY